ncbi:crotonase/enoyl-CoA hydratase family protein [Nocardioides sp. CER19]|uniref:crotonase/enoyl-CoA hydratase family protein n=1 Tax=Nocardioides sp. CER19 TaxID=3038538 RepID=UPI002447A4DF|nr:crotonase/enoyl-CoA hydratase family protein [Nocardioides sp. CER19]MDH2413476.1 crotonase/enoyl-CoA hydratase family protein [Nocardioides sp. CER19]
MAGPLLITREGHVETWTLNLPERRNPISDLPMVEALEEAATRVTADVSVRAVILTGAGPAFSSGGDVKAMAERTGMFGGTGAEIADGYRRGIQRIPRSLYHCPVPLIAAVNGPAVGAGCDLTLMCDIRVASTSAFFAESFVKVGLIPGDGGAFLLPRVVGAARAAEMSLTGDRIDAQTALAWGLVSRVVAPDDLLPAAREIADRIAANPPVAVRAGKQLLREAATLTLDEVLDKSADVQALMHQTADHAEAVIAFVEKRQPRFTGE